MATQLQEPVTTPDVIEEQTQERDFETEARGHGWKPQEEFQGDPAKWTDAETFVKRADEIMPLMKAQNGDLRRKVKELESAMKRLSKSEQAAHRDKLEALQAARLEAFDSGDREAFVAAEKKAEELRKDMGDPDIQATAAARIFNFREENPWYDKGGLGSATPAEAEARALCDRISDRMCSEGLNQRLSPDEFYSQLEAEVNERLPTLKVRPIRPKPASDVAASTRSAPRGAAKTGAALPPEAKETAERYIRLKLPGYAGKSAAEAHNLFAQSYFDQ